MSSLLFLVAAYRLTGWSTLLWSEKGWLVLSP